MSRDSEIGLGNRFPVRQWWFVVLVVLVAAVNDGWSGRPSPFLHQLLILPFTILFSVALFLLLRPSELQDPLSSGTIASGLLICLGFELVSIGGFWHEEHHFAQFGYKFGRWQAGLLAVVVVLAAGWVAWRRTGASVVGAALVSYGAGLLVAIWSFPLNYLRSDMLPVILWSDTRLVSRLNPYATMHVGSRIYDFPYLPGVLVAYLPAVALHLDLRFINLFCVAAIAVLVYGAASPERKLEAAAMIGVFLLSPFLQYRHDLYLGPHWLALTAALVLMQKRHYAWAAAGFGVGMAVYQLSWVLFPFLLLHGFRHRGWREAVKLAVLGAAGALFVVGPFLGEATRRIASNTVGQWSRLPHALADPINLSYWLTYLVRPDHLKWLQLAAMTGIFLYCVVKRRCDTFVDTLRWMSGALALFIAMNVLVDGYFYLTLLLMLLVFTCAASGIWEEPTRIETQQLRSEHARPSRQHLAATASR